MKTAKDSDNSYELMRPLVMRSLRRSNVRKRVAEYLFDINPSGSYTSEIAYKVHTTSTNVIGALRGINSRYRDDESLIGLNIVEQVDASKSYKIYKLTDFGKEIISTIKEENSIL